MKLFSERYGYTKPSDIIIREQITPEIQNAICSCYDRLIGWFHEYRTYDAEAKLDYIELEEYLWTNVLNKRIANFSKDGSYYIVATTYMESVSHEWYEKLNLIEITIQYLRNYDQKDYRRRVAARFTETLNSEFERLHFAYRIINDEIVEINSKEEIQSIERALIEAPSNIRTHLSKALELYAQRPTGDFRNSIKESISAVEAWCREKTGAKDLGGALSNLEKNGINLHPMLKQTFEKLYAYTNQPTTGSRHALMDETEKYTPKAEEALFMLVSCSAFINYLNKKV